MRAAAPPLPGRSTLPLLVAVASACGMLVGGGEPNGLLALIAVSVLTAGCWLLWRPGESPILLFVFCYQWLQASVKIFHANWRGVEVGALAEVGGDLAGAITVNLVGLLVLAIGMRLGVGAWSPWVGEIAKTVARRHGILSWFKLYVAVWILANVAQSFAWALPGISQPIFALATVKWAFFWMLTYATFVQPGANRLWWLLAFGAELAMSVGGFFSDFKTVFVYTLLAVAASGFRLSLRRALMLSCLVAGVLSLSLVWTAVKPEYRKFVSEGEIGQVVRVGYYDRTAKLVELVGELNGEDIDRATEDLLNRLAYVDYFALVIENVPSVMEHEGGALWWDAVTRPFMPRMFFPEKSNIQDSERTIIYTGVRVAGEEAGASISIGYMGESYIDFGRFGMMAPLFGLGLLLGGLYRWFVNHRRAQGPLGLSLATVVVANMSALESSITKTFGGLVITTLVAWLVLRYVAPKYFPWVRAPANGA